MTPPSGGIATTKISDARGNVVELRQYASGQPSGSYQAQFGKQPRASRVHKGAYTELVDEKTVNVREARAHLADHINRAEQGVPTIITRNGTPVAAVVPIADFEALEEAADLLLAREAEAVLAENGPTVTMAELLADLFTEHGDEAA